MSNTAFTVNAGMADGRTLNEFAKSIDTRVKWLGTAREKAAGAAMINALTSLRKRTRRGPKPDSANAKLDACYRIERTGHAVAVRTVGGIRKWVPVLGGRLDSSIKPVYLCHGADSKSMAGAGLWRITFLSDGKLWDRTLNGEMYYVLALSEGTAIAYARSRAKKYLDGLSGLARSTLTKAAVKMANAINRKANANDGEKLNQRSQAVSQNASKARSSRSGESLALHAESSLSYATDALEGREGAIDEALAAVTRKTVGMIEHTLKQKGLLDRAVSEGDFTRPFE